MKSELKPFIKWAGGKKRLLLELESRLPDNINEYTYYEPFIGGGALFLYLQPKNAVINDINSELMNIWTVIRDNHNELLQTLDKMKNTKEEYYAIRSWDQLQDWKNQKSPVERAARFIYLNKLCFNGIWRENKSGFMNVPYNGNTKPISSLVNFDNIRNISEYLNKANIEILNCDYNTLISKDKSYKNTFWYLDPPYADLDFRKTFDSYNANVISNDTFHENLKDSFTILSDNGALIMESNSNATSVKELYKDYNIDNVYLTRCVGGAGSDRKQIKELIIKNY